LTTKYHVVDDVRPSTTTDVMLGLDTRRL